MYSHERERGVGGISLAADGLLYNTSYLKNVARYRTCAFHTDDEATLLQRASKNTIVCDERMFPVLCVCVRVCVCPRRGYACCPRRTSAGPRMGGDGEHGARHPHLQLVDYLLSGFLVCSHVTSCPNVHDVAVSPRNARRAGGGGGGHVRLLRRSVRRG